MDEKTLADYNSKLAKVQERVDVILSAGELIGDDLRQTLADLGVVFNDKDKKDNDVEGEAGSPSAVEQSVGFIKEIEQQII